MNKKAEFAVNVLVAWGLIVGGMCLAGWLSPTRTVYPIIIAASLWPAALFLKFRLPMSWHRFAADIGMVTILGLVVAVLRRLGIANDDLTPLIAIGIVLFAGPLLGLENKADAGDS